MTLSLLLCAGFVFPLSRSRSERAATTVAAVTTAALPVRQQAKFASYSFGHILFKLFVRLLATAVPCELDTITLELRSIGTMTVALAGAAVRDWILQTYIH